MAEGGEQYAEEGEKLNQQQQRGAQAAAWSQQQQQQQGGRPRWLEPAVNGDGQGKKGDGDGREGVRQGMPVQHEAEDDSGLELCLGLSLGGGNKGRSREVKMPGSSDSGGEKLKDAGSKPGLNNFELSSKNLGRKEFGGDGGDVKFEGPMRGGPLPGFDAWRPPAGEEEAKLAMQHMAAMHAMQAGKVMQMEQQQQQQNGGAKEEVPFYQDLQQGLAHNAAAAAMAFNSAMVWARFAQVAANGVPPVQLMEPFGKDGGGGGAHGGPDAAGRMVLQPSGPSGSFPQGLHFEQGMHPGQQQQQQQPLQRQASGMSAADQALQDANLDPQARQRLEQQRKNQAQAQRRQEARKKRKFQQEQKLQKKAKKEDEPRMAAPPVGKPRAGTPPAGSLKSASSLPANCKEVSSPPDSQEGASGGSVGSGFRRMGSGSWPRGSLGLPPEKSDNGASSVGDQEAAGEQMQEIKRVLQNLSKDRERASKDKDRDSGAGSAPSEDRKAAEHRLKAEETVWPQAGPEGNHDVARQQPAPTNPGVNVLDMARLGQEGWFQKLMEAQMVNPGLQQAAMAALMHEHAAAAPSSGDHSQGQRRREPLERTSSAVDHDRLRSSPENSVDRKGSPLRFDGRSGDKPAAGKVNLPTPPFPGNVPMTGMPGVPPGFPPANFMPMPYPFPIPIPNAAGFPFPFPYLLQPGPAPGGPDAQHNGPRPMHGPNGSPFQLLVTPPGFAPFLPNPEMGAPWPQVVRPQAANIAAVSPPKSIARTASGMSEDEVARNQGSKTSEKNRSRSSSPTEEQTSGVRGIPTPPTATTKQTGGAFASMRNGSIPNFPPPQFGLPRAMSEGGERMLPREGSVGSAFASLTMSNDPAESGETKPQVKAPVENGVKHERSRDATTAPEESGGSAVTQLGACGDTSNSDADRTGAAGAGSGMTQQGTDGKSSNPLTGQASIGSSSLAQTAPAANASEKVTRESRIAPGVAAGEVFGGTGNIPQLPWVQCTGAGPNGKTICGALYSCQKVIKIVCKCHGNHMTPAEFVAHAGGGDVANPEKAITVSHFSLPNQAAIAHG